MAVHLGMSTYDVLAPSAPTNATPTTMLQKFDADLQLAFSALNNPQPGDSYIFMVPEFYFSRCKGALHGPRQLNRSERDQIIRGLVTASAANPDVLLIAGTILWYSFTPFYKTVKAKHFWSKPKTVEEEAFDVLNMAVILHQGKVIKSHFKQSYGGELVPYDAALLEDYRDQEAAQNPNLAQQNPVQFRGAQVSTALGTRDHGEVSQLLEKFKGEGYLRYQPPSDTGEFTWNQLACGVEICQDHNSGTLKKAVGQTLDYHFLISNTVGSLPGSFAARPSGTFIHCQAGNWNVGEPDIYQVAANGTTTRLQGAATKLRATRADGIWYWCL